MSATCAECGKPADMLFHGNERQNMARTGSRSPEIVPKSLPTQPELLPMPRRRLYVVDLDTGREVKSIDVEGMPETKIIAFERQLWAQCGDELVVRDSSFDREDRQP